MGRYDGPSFEVRGQNFVSVWVANCGYAAIPDNYFLENYDGGDDDPFNQFSSDFGFGYYDHDFVESYCIEPAVSVPVVELLKPLSYSSSFIDEATRRCKDIGLEVTCYVILIYEFKYDPAVTKVWKSDYMNFVGTFRYRVEAPNDQNRAV